MVRIPAGQKENFHVSASLVSGCLVLCAAAVRLVEGLKPGLYRYLPDVNALALVRQGDLSRPLCEAAWNQRFVESAPVNIVITAVVSRTERRYKERAERYVFMEAGHAGQNLYLEASAMGLGTVAVGAFDDERIQSVMGISEKVLYLFPVGFPGAKKQN
jgi:SagB-type dehydrogenase family enzyme